MLRVPLAALAATLVLASTAEARDVVVTSFDGTPIAAHLYPAEGLAPGQRAPTVLVGHGWGGRGSTDPESSSPPGGTVGNGPLRRAGYNVLSWDARGFGASGGVVQVDAPRAEARDVQALLDFLATAPEARLDGPGDPRAGMVGGSYGGGIQLTTAAIGERRVDAMVPDIAWHSLATSLYPDATFKSGWGNALVAAGRAGANPLGGGLDPHVTRAADEANATGELSAADRRWYESRGPGAALSRSRIPTLLTQGTPDTLFPLDEAARNYAILRKAGAPVKMLWHCGGHSPCTTPGGNGDDTGHVERAVLAWLARHLAGDARVDTGPGFEWLADDGRWRQGSEYPLPAGAVLAGRGSGRLKLRPSATPAGDAFASRPARGGIEVAVPAPRRTAQVASAPRLTMTYRGTGAPRGARVFAQIVDTRHRVVLGNEATPIPVVLDGRRRTVSRRLEIVAVALRASSRLRLQVIGAAGLYGRQRADASLAASRVRIALTTVGPRENR